MLVTLTIIRYKTFFIPFAFFAMAIHRLPLWLNKDLSFYKLMGCGKNGTFDKVPDLKQWAILTIRDKPLDIADHGNDKQLTTQLVGNFISKWYDFFGCETCSFLMEPLESHGKWDGKKVFGETIKTNEHTGVLAVLTRATIRMNKLKFFWGNVAPVANKMNQAKGLLFTAGVGEVPWVKQATFSIWRNKEDMVAFAYGMKEHHEVIKKTREQNWYSEEMFTRFKIIHTIGTIKGARPTLL